MTGTRLPDELAQAVRSLGLLLNYVRLDPRKGDRALPEARLLRSDRARTWLGRYVATELSPKLARYIATELSPKLGRYVATVHVHVSVAT
ncbi:hypothetical protein DY000_02034076 [Brassica cretica]|uniref:Uncharacterized protein n=1 Tax=Brassica cretica TaxID=69181 RepID=A0ABQ7DSB9_BRACR|nr:hypothetical protein DY000_02034076 [Brassica cretica]